MPPIRGDESEILHFGKSLAVNGTDSEAFKTKEVEKRYREQD